ncbi:DEAD/DEAH box helicase [Enhygromyxa salina]|uniref:DEAD/DEAH box helicase n=1 Tax=Enhygromyxa salina TaxID=215803 RepID=UPI000696D0C2|nr:DEAD/DEAH box helicase [Enhygromyxa salina]
MTINLDRPPADRLTAARVRGLLAWLSPRGRLPEDALAKVPDLVGALTVIQREWAKDPWLEFPDGEGLWCRIDARCGCSTHDKHGFCEHRAAVVVLELWRRPDGRELFDRPSWQLELDYLLRDRPSDGLSTEAAPPPSPRSDRACRLLIHVFPTGGYERGFDFDVQLLRANKRGDGWLKPIRCPSSVDKLRAKANPSDELLRVHDLIAQLTELRKLDTYARQAPRLRARVAHELLAALAEAGEQLELRWEQLPIVASTLVWRPTLRISAGEPGLLEARWSDGVLDHWRLEPSIVLTSAGILRPLADDIPAHLLDRIGVEPVQLSVDDFDQFARTILAHAPVPIEIPTPLEVGASAVARREARLYLEERGEVLRCTAKLAYELADGRCVELGLHARGGLSFGDDMTLVRDAKWERARRAEFTDRVGREASVELLEEWAWTFLSEGMPALRERGWVVFGEHSLTHNRVLAEPLGPRMRLGPSTDWFELEVDFAAEGEGGAVVAAPEVIASWLAGQRFVRLPDTRLAALPTRWLDRHGRALAELVELGDARNTQHGLGAHALPLASELLGEFVSDDPEQSARATHWRGRARALASFEGVAQREPPASLQAQLRGYQQRGFAWLCYLRDHGLGGCLADDMGLGKTVQALALLLDTHSGAPQGPPSLIVCPTSVLHTWREQADRFAPTLRVHLHHGPRRGTPPAEGTTDVIMTSYALLRHDAQLWQAMRFRHLILDEAQALKNPDSQLAQVARSLSVAHPVALTGTPLENNVVELWSLFELLMPGFFGSRRRFRKRWVEPIHKHEDGAALARLRRRLRPFLLRRLKREVAAELPPKQVQVLRCRLGKEQRQMYERVRATYRASVFGAVDKQGIGAATLHILEALTRLRQACCHPALLPFPEARELGGRVAKLELLRLLLVQASADGHRSLVFSTWPSFLDHVSTDLSAAGIAHLRLDGSTRDRAGVLERWQDPAGPPVFLISTKAGGLGLNLTEADHVFHLDPWWNPASEDQATDRAHRIGQTKPVMVYKLVAADTVEDKILELQARKRKLFNATIDTDRLEVDALTRADLEAVFADPSASGLDEEDDDLEDDFPPDDEPLPEPAPRALAQFIPLPSSPDSPSPAKPATVSAAQDSEAAVIQLFPRPPKP